MTCLSRLALVCWNLCFEAELTVEALGSELDYELLPGLWRLTYTTAVDVVGAPCLS